MPDGFTLPEWVARMDVVVIVHLAIALSALELLGRLTHAVRRGHLPVAWGQVLHVGAGLCLMFALREALTESRPAWLLLWLSASGAAHVADIAWRRHAALQAKTSEPVRPS